METITIDGQDYELDKLSVEVKAQLQSLQFVNMELQRLNAQIAVFQTAQVAYSTELRKILPPPVQTKKPKKSS